MRHHWMKACVLASVAFLLAAPASAQTYRIASPNEAIDIVTADDPYMRNLTPADLSIRLQLRDGGTPQQLKAVYAAGVTVWSEVETTRLSALVERHRDKLAALSTWLPESVLFIKGSRAIDGGLPHTRANAIVFGPNLPATDAGLDSLFFHELFHILSRHVNVAARESLYGLIGFERCTSVTLPPNLRGRAVSNPDVEDGAFTVEVEGGPEGTLDLMPYLTSNPERFDPAKPVFQSYFQLVFLNMKRGPRGACSLVTVTGESSIFPPAAVQAALFKTVGHNTNYVFHAEETLADNFAFLMTGKSDVPDPWVLDKLRARLALPPG
ncbi:MAG: hypothetical protein SGJ23_03595 [Alphaproteobacteria bacterium]|nr:hypothetical protein [Alphaproteobacteria bacterium]